MTAAEQLAEVQTAISKILVGGQEYMMGGRRMRRADLPVLYKERDRLEAMIASADGRDVTVAYFDKR